MIQDLRHAARMMQRNPGFTLVAIAALALGVGANTAVFTVLHGVLLRPLAFPEPARLQVVSYAGIRGPFGPGVGLSEDIFLEFQEQNHSFERVATYYISRPILTGAGEAVRLQAAGITSDFFHVLRVNAALGRGVLPEDLQSGHDPVVVIGDRLWRTRFNADTGVIGRSIQLDSVNHTVIGVMPPEFAFPDAAAAWIPFQVRVTPGNSFLRPTIGRLKAGQKPEQALAELQAITTRLDPNPGTRNPPVARIFPVKDMLVSRIRESLWIFAGAVAFVLLIACANVANLQLMRAASRQQEIAVRAALGAGRKRLLRQLLTESAVVSMAGGAAGLLVALWGVPALLALAPQGRIPRVADVRVDGAVLAFTLGVSLATGLLFGLIPALHATRRQIRDSLSHGSRTVSARYGGLRSALAVAEIALALVLVTGAGLMAKSFLLLRAVDPGFRPENAIAMTVQLPRAVYRTAEDSKAFHQRMLERLSLTPGVTAVGAVNYLPLAGNRTIGDFKIQDRGYPSNYFVEKEVVSPGYFQAMGIPLMSGRDFSDRDNAASPGVVMISQSVARRLWPNEDVIGKRLSERDHPGPGDWLSVVGVVDDIHHADLAAKANPALYFSYQQSPIRDWLSDMTFVARTMGEPSAVAPAMREALRAVDANQPVESMVTLDGLIARTIAEPLFQARLLAVFSFFALALAAIGVCGVLSHAVASRTQEIGLRMALGAGHRDVMQMVLRRTLRLAATGVALGTGGALLATRVLKTLLFEVKPTDESTFIGVALALTAVALAAGWIPARRATRVDPMVALRYE